MSGSDAVPALGSPDAGPREEAALRSETRTVLSLTASRICLLLSALLILVEAYLFWGPLDGSVANGFPPDCGSAASPPHDSPGKVVCGVTNERRLAQALTALGASVIVGARGVLASGLDRLDRLGPPRTPQAS